jgi:competence protein ComEC
MRSAWCTAGEGWEIDGVRFDILFPDAAARAAGLSDNEGNCVLRVSTATGSVLIPGDLEKRGEALLLDAVAQQGQTLVSDLLLLWLDPRIRLSGSR